MACLTYSRQAGSQVGGEWKIQSIQGPTTYTIIDGDRTRTVYVNRICPWVQPTPVRVDTDKPLAESNWEAPSIEHHTIALDKTRITLPS